MATQNKNLEATGDEPARHGFWATIREGLHGSQRDFTEIPIGRAVILLSLPMVAEMVMESLFAVVDIFYVSRLGSDAVAVVGLTESMLAIMYAMGMGLSMGATAVVARRIGEKDPEGACVAAVQAIGLAVIVALLLGVLGFSFGPRLLEFMGAAPEVVALGSDYTRVMLGGNITIFLLFVVNAIFRGAGDASISMRTLWLANGLNIILCPIFIFGFGPVPALGVTGAAVGTTIGRGLGVLYPLFRLMRGGDRVRIRARHLRLDVDVLTRVVKIGAAATLQMLIETASWIGLVRILSSFGSAALAGYTIAIRILIFALLPSWGMANAAATLVGQNLGAKKPERAEASVWVAGRYNLIFLGCVGLCFIVFAEPLVGIFTQDAAVLPYAIGCLRYVAVGFLFFAYGMVIVQALNGAGDTRTPTLINFAAFWLFKIPVAYVLAVYLGLGPDGVFLAVPLAYSVAVCTAVLVFRRGRWKTVQV